MEAFRKFGTAEVCSSLWGHAIREMKEFKAEYEASQDAAALLVLAAWLAAPPTSAAPAEGGATQDAAGGSGMVPMSGEASGGGRSGAAAGACGRCRAVPRNPSLERQFPRRSGPRS